MITSPDQPLAFGGSSSVTVGVSWQRPLASGEPPQRAIQALLRSVGAALSTHFEGRAAARLDGESTTATVTLRIPEPDGSIKVCDVAVTLLVDELTRGAEDDVEMVIVARVRAEFRRRRGGLDWLARDADADVEQLVSEIEGVLSAVSP
jgi:hypothetical protein